MAQYPGFDAKSGRTRPRCRSRGATRGDHRRRGRRQGRPKPWHGPCAEPDRCRRPAAIVAHPISRYRRLLDRRRLPRKAVRRPVHSKFGTPTANLDRCRRLGPNQRHPIPKCQPRATFAASPEICPPLKRTTRLRLMSQVMARLWRAEGPVSASWTQSCPSQAQVSPK